MNNYSENGGVICNESNLQIYDCYFAKNEAQNGGAIYNQYKAYIVGSSIEHNNSQHGGGIYNTGSLTLSGVNIIYNICSGRGGGIYNIGSCDIDICSIQGNISMEYGSGIYTEKEIKVRNSRFLDNNPTTIDGPTDAIHNWWGDNNGPERNSITETLKYNPWLVASFNIAQVGNEDLIVKVNINKNSNGESTKLNLSHFPKNNAFILVHSDKAYVMDETPNFNGESITRVNTRGHDEISITCKLDNQVFHEIIKRKDLDINPNWPVLNY